MTGNPRHRRLCDLLGLDPDEVVDVTITLDRNVQGSIRWTGHRSLEPVEVTQLMAHSRLSGWAPTTD